MKANRPALKIGPGVLGAWSRLAVRDDGSEQAGGGEEQNERPIFHWRTERFSSSSQLKTRWIWESLAIGGTSYCGSWEGAQTRTALGGKLSMSGIGTSCGPINVP